MNSATIATQKNAETDAATLGQTGPRINTTMLRTPQIASDAIVMLLVAPRNSGALGGVHKPRKAVL